MLTNMEATMRRLMLIAAIGWCLTEAAQAAPIAYEIQPQESVLEFEGHSTLHGFTGTSRELSGELLYDPDQHRLAQPTEILVPVASFRTGNDRRDRAMRAMFEADRFPAIRMTVTSIDPLEASADAGGRRRYRLSGQAQVRAVTQPVAVDVWAMESPDSIEASGELRLTASQFGLKPPSVAGLIRVRDELVVRFNTRWRPSP
jgi:polyisoprenoid-binding protein YceI